MEEILWMSGKDKKEKAEKLIREGDKRSYNEIKADIELHQWTMQHKGYLTSKSKPKQ